MGVSVLLSSLIPFFLPAFSLFSSIPPSFGNSFFYYFSFRSKTFRIRLYRDSRKLRKNCILSIPRGGRAMQCWILSLFLSLHDSSFPFFPSFSFLYTSLGYWGFLWVLIP
ncbi:hypothetical protein V8C43DRAFT_264193 [Trichoderma afarasin]